MGRGSQRSLFGATNGPVVGEVERWCRSRGYRVIIGVDEAGRGPLAGPVHAAAVALNISEVDAPWLAGLDDSKKLDEGAREQAFLSIQERSMAWAIEASDRAVIDDVNILQATLRAMERAVERVARRLSEPVDCIFIDGNIQLMLDSPQRAIVKGDARSFAIAAASILAKVSRDAVMREHHARWPGYGFDSHKGYPTAKHRDAIARLGPCPIHRRTFGGVREHLEKLRGEER